MTLSMRRLAALLLAAATGCSTAPVADLLDFCCPPKTIPNGTPCFGGVGGPQITAPPPAAVQPPPTLPTLSAPAAEKPVPLAGSS
jgi:hypothetical protein